MANFYLRVPHYVAAYYRNQYKKESSSASSPVTFDKNSTLWKVLCCALQSNHNYKIVKFGCFCERQWRNMMSGNYILPDKFGKKCRTILAKGKDETLSDEEISILSGLPARKGNDTDEYLCIKLPGEVRKCDEIDVCKTNGQWQLMSEGAKQIHALMMSEFWQVFYIYMNQEKLWCASHGIERTLLDSIERFMSRYGIRNSNSNREKETLRRNYNRKFSNLKFSADSFVEFGN